MDRLEVSAIPTISPSATIAEIEQLLLRKTKELATINYIYVIDGKKLVGVLSVRELFRSPKNAFVSSLMRKDLVTARSHTSPARVALLAIEHNLKEVPIVDAEGTLEGVVPYDAILRTLHAKHIENTLRTAGITTLSATDRAGAFSLIIKRLPWLLIGLAGTAVTALVINTFDTLLSEHLLLASFIPAIAYLSDAVGTQSETLLIREEALNPQLSFRHYLLRDLMSSVGLGTFLALAMAIISFTVSSNAVISLILAISVFIAAITATFFALSIPWLSARMRFDPALVGGPLDTIISDIASTTIYFAVASAIFSMLT